MKKLLLVALTVILLTICSFASSPDELASEGMEGFGVGELAGEVPDSAREFAKEYDLKGLSIGDVLTMSPQDLFRAVWQAGKDAFRDMRGGLFSIIGVVLLCAMLDTVRNSKGDSPLGPVFETVCVLAVTAALSGPVIGCIKSAAASIVDASLFLISYVPVFAAVTAASGMPMTAAAYSGAIMAVSELIAQFAANILIPLIGVYLSFSMVGCVSRNEGLMSIAGSFKTVITWTLSLAMTVFVGILTLQSFLSSAGDSAAIKTTKFLIGSFVPVVGGAISDALSAAQGSIKLIKASVGGLGIAVAAFTFLPILIRVCIWRAVLALSQAAGELLGTGQVKSILKAFSNVLSVLTAMILSVALLIIISTAVMLTLGGGGI